METFVHCTHRCPALVGSDQSAPVVSSTKLSLSESAQHRDSNAKGCVRRCMVPMPVPGGRHAKAKTQGCPTDSRGLSDWVVIRQRLPHVLDDFDFLSVSRTNAARFFLTDRWIWTDFSLGQTHQDFPMFPPEVTAIEFAAVSGDLTLLLLRLLFLADFLLFLLRSREFPARSEPILKRFLRLR